MNRQRHRFFCLLIATLLPLLLLCGTAAAQRGKRLKNMPGEQALVYRIVELLANKDPDSYAALFPDMDTLSKVMMLKSDSASPEFRHALTLQENATAMFRADSAQRAFHKAIFDSVITRGEAVYGIRWSGIVPRRYELVKARQTRDRRYELLAPERFRGLVYIVDPSTNRNYAFTITDILLINGAWYGGNVSHLFEAFDADEYEDQLMAYLKRRRLGLPEKPAGAVAEDTENARTDTLVNSPTKKLVVERKFYTGMFDNEIPIQLYIRRLRGGCPDTSASDGCLYEGIYKFGDQDGYIKLDVTRSADGKWHLAEVPAEGEMELSLKNGVFTGTWLSEDGVTGYDAKLTEMPASAKKAERLDRIIDTEAYGE